MGGSGFEESIVLGVGQWVKGGRGKVEGGPVLAR